MICEFFSNDSDIVSSMLRTLEKHPNKRIKEVYYIRQYLIFEIGD